MPVRRSIAALFLLVCSVRAADVVPGRYIVELNAEPVLSAEVTAAAGKAVRRSAVRQSQQSLRRALAAESVTVTGTVENVANALLVRMADAKAAEVAAMPGVKRVHPVRRHRMFLDQASEVHHVPQAWQIAGELGGGAGVKIAIIDSGIDPAHPGFDGSGLQMPAGYPRVDKEDHRAFTSNKIIAARSYADYFEVPEEDGTPRDHVGHGTATAVIAAGVTSAGPLTTITGVAPRAWLGVYRVFGSPDTNESAPTDAVLKAIDDAVADGMDVINMSFGSVIAPILIADIEVDAIERASAAGVLVVLSSGNNGPNLGTIGSPATAPSGITVGAIENKREFLATVTVEGAAYSALPAAGPRPESPVRGALRDVATVDSSGLLCDPAPAGSLEGRVALILRGTCSFEAKLSNAKSAGALGALVYTTPERAIVAMEAGPDVVPAMMLSNADGIALKERAAANPDLRVELDFVLRAVERNPFVLTSFTSKGPSVDLSIKPDLVAVGKDVYTGTQREFNSSMLDPSGYTSAEGTSFSSPLVAGIAALLKAARPGLTAQEYKSILISSVMPLWVGMQSAGAGLANAESALYSRLAFSPASLSLGSVPATAERTRNLRIRNIANETAEYLITVEGDQPAPQVSADRITLRAGESATIQLRFQGSDLPGAAYQGYVVFVDPITTHSQRVPYWYAVPSGSPARVTVLHQEIDGRSNTTLRDAILFRVTDASGLDVPLDPAITVAAGTGSVVGVSRFSTLVPGVFSASLRLARGANVFRITAGEVQLDVGLTGN